MMSMESTHCGCLYDGTGVVTDLCETHYRTYMVQVERRMNCSNGSCGE